MGLGIGADLGRSLGEAVTGGSKCALCGAQMPANARFCPECGASVRRVCPECGTELSASAKFCPKCGKKI